ncbi:hypothetical protein DFH08DRAFT_803365 [Mycena albidolilacea]|uniref:Uncharacterized protein n=1 Tax=Mycena albidolilacea TaxID=1033008 RepID=A0AAD7EXX1_9AGAR|nr:hypothetical protein DFH08DRAFT_803365 [Mycena albidolilacea]
MGTPTKLDARHSFSTFRSVVVRLLERKTRVEPMSVRRQEFEGGRLKNEIQETSSIETISTIHFQIRRRALAPAMWPKVITYGRQLSRSFHLSEHTIMSTAHRVMSNRNLNSEGERIDDTARLQRKVKGEKGKPDWYTQARCSSTQSRWGRSGVRPVLRVGRDRGGSKVGSSYMPPQELEDVTGERISMAGPNSWPPSGNCASLLHGKNERVEK